jgi:hypothetical protein
MSTTNGPVPGTILPTVSGPQGPPGQAAIDASNQKAVSAVALAKIGGRNKRGGAISVPQFSNDTSGANAVIAKSTGNGATAASNAQYDNQLHSGGKRRSRGKRRTIKGKKRTIKGGKKRTIKGKRRSTYKKTKK